MSDSCSISKNESKRRERVASKEAMASLVSEFNTDVDDIFSGVLEDIENFCVYDEEIIFNGQFTHDVLDCVSSYSDRHQQVVLRDVPVAYGHYLEGYLNADAWVTTDDVGKGDVSNYTVKYNEIVKYVEDHQ